MLRAKYGEATGLVKANVVLSTLVTAAGVVGVMVLDENIMGALLLAAVAGLWAFFSFRIAIRQEPRRYFPAALVCLAALILLGLYAELTTPATPPVAKRPEMSPASQAEREAAALRTLGERAVKAQLKDDESSRFRGQFIGKSGAPCGEVNAKNSFGAYAGFSRYVASGSGLVVLEAEMPPGEFDKVWSQLCR